MKAAPASELRTGTANPLGAFPGAQRVLTVAQPAPGAEWSLTLPSGAWWRIIGGITTLVCSASVANRYPCLRYSVSGTPVLEGTANAAAVASASVQVNYCGALALGAAAAGSVSNVSYPLVLMQPGQVIASHTYNLQAADQYGSVALLMEEIYTGPDGEPYLQQTFDELTGEQRLALARS